MGVGYGASIHLRCELRQRLTQNGRKAISSSAPEHGRTVVECSGRHGRPLRCAGGSKGHTGINQPAPLAQQSGLNLMETK
jgi:hypothetical protein